MIECASVQIASYVLAKDFKAIVSYEGDDPYDDAFSYAIYRQGEDILHVTMGVGIAFSVFQIDFGADLSQTSDVFTLSAIYSF